MRRLAEVLPDDVKVTLLAGFADTKLFGFLDELGFDYVIRLKGNTKVSAGRPVRRPRGSARAACKLRDATAAQCPVGAVVCVQAKGMKEAFPVPPGCMLYDLIPNMPEHRLRPLVEQYAEILQQSRVVTETFAIV